MNFKNPINDAELLALRQRNRQRAEQLREQMGTGYVLHPDNKVRRNEAQFIRAFIEGMRRGNRQLSSTGA